jgi:PKHD-type hydroxylase
MHLVVKDFLNSDELAEIASALPDAEWRDGRATAGYQSRQKKNNQQLEEGSPLARRLGEIIMGRLERTPSFVAAALPLKMVPPLFNRYGIGETYGDHIDGAIRAIPNSPLRVRNDLSATVFLADPETYDGGELVLQGEGGETRFKLPAGAMLLYEAGCLHRVEPVTRGARYASFFWVQSMVRDGFCRQLLFDLDNSIQRLAHERIDHPEVTPLTQHYHQLLRLWADT